MGKILICWYSIKKKTYKFLKHSKIIKIPFKVLIKIRGWWKKIKILKFLFAYLFNVKIYCRSSVIIIPDRAFKKIIFSKNIFLLSTTIAFNQNQTTQITEFCDWMKYYKKRLIFLFTGCVQFRHFWLHCNASEVNSRTLWKSDPHGQVYLNEINKLFVFLSRNAKKYL